MTRMINRWKNSALIIIAFALMAIFFGSCNGVLGFGDALDFDPPELHLLAGPNPRYVSSSVPLEGLCFDNVAVDRIICRVVSPEIHANRILGEVRPTGNTWKMNLNFNPSDNGERFSVVVIAYDRAGNSGELSKVALDIIVDMRPPIFESVEIYRSSRRVWPLESLAALYALEESDPDADIPTNADRYQNEAFWIRASVFDEDSSIKENSLKESTLVMSLFHVVNPNPANYREELVYSAPRDRGTLFAPEWTIKAEEITDHGNLNARYEAGERLYFRMRIQAEDMAGNVKIEDYFGENNAEFKYFCLYKNGDIPKARLSVFYQFVNPKTPIPLDVFDDDSLAEAYVGLLTLNQFLAHGATGDTNEQILEKIRKKIQSGTTVYNWRNEKKSGDTTAAARVTNRISSGDYVESLSLSIEAGENDSDCDNYMLIVIARDKKSAPKEIIDLLANPDAGWGYKAFPIIVADNNSPIIVIDTVNVNDPDYELKHKKDHLGFDIIGNASTGNSPEENTFPALDDVYGKYFTIQGFTLRLSDEAGKDSPNPAALAQQKVSTFKIAWIPYGLGQDENLDRVMKAMRYEEDPSHEEYVTYPTGVQHWTLGPHSGSNNISYYTDGTPQVIGGATYAKQTFKKRFNILGDSPDELKSSYMNFHYGCTCTGTITEFRSCIENEPKLFVLYARDNFNHHVYKTIRLLGKKDPPAVRMYVMTQLADSSSSYLALEEFDKHPTRTTLGISDTTFDPTNKLHQQVYYNNISGMYSNLHLMNPDTHPNLAKFFETYPRHSTLWVYVKAEDAGGVKIASNGIKLYDITKAHPSTLSERGHINAASQDITYAERLSDLDQRVFLIEAKNMFGITASVQRTVAVTSTAMLENIITALPSGEYGVWEVINGANVKRKIPLRAHFSALVNVIPNRLGKLPHLNIRYETAPNEWVYKSIPFTGEINDPNMYLLFDFEVPDGTVAGLPAANGRLYTLDSTHADDASKNAAATAPHVCTQVMVGGRLTTVCSGGLLDNDRPISLPFDGVDYLDVLNHARIVDSERNDPALIVDGAKIIWDSYRSGSLQVTKSIRLDGQSPVITSLVVSGKAPYTDYSEDGEFGENYFYFKATGDLPGERAGETISFEIKSNKDIRAQDSPRIRFRIRMPNGVMYPDNANPTNFYADYLRPAGTKGLVFVREVNPDNVSPTNPKLPDGTIESLLLDTASGNILDRVENRLNATTLNNHFEDFYTPAGSRKPYFVRIDTIAPNAPVAMLSRPFGHNPPKLFPLLNSLPAGETYMYSVNPILEITGAVGNEPWGSFGEYSLDRGLSWEKIGVEKDQWTTIETGVNDYGKMKISSGPWELTVRRRDKAGNISPASPIYRLDIDAEFPQLVSIGLVNPDGVYKRGQSLTFQLDFDRPIYTTITDTNSTARAYIIVSDTGTSPTDHGTTNPADERAMRIYADRLPKTDRSSTLTFTWRNIGNNVNDRKKMENGLTVTAIILNGDVEDHYGNEGTNYEPTTTKTVGPLPAQSGIVKMFSKHGVPGTYNVGNLHGYGVKVYAIPPALLENQSDPSNAEKYVSGAPTFVMTDNHTITLKFDSNMQKGVGNIIIKPHGTYPVPPVFPATAYVKTEKIMLDADTVKTSNKVYVDSFLEIYSRVPSTQRTNLLRGTFENPTLTGVSGVTALPGTTNTNVVGKGGLYLGPYIYNTQGLEPGPGYDAAEGRLGVTYLGNETVAPKAGAPVSPGWNREWAITKGTESEEDYLDKDAHFMVPDDSAKYVLHYELNINDTTAGGVVANIRTALEAAHFRWREIDVSMSGSSTSDYDYVTVNTADHSKVEIKLYYALPQGMRWTIYWEEGVFEDPAGNAALAMQPGSFVFWSDGVQEPVIRVQRRSVDYKAAMTSPFYPGNLAYSTGTAAPYSVGALASVAYKIESETPEIGTISSGTILGSSATGVNGRSAITFEWTSAISGILYSWDNTTAGGRTSVAANDTGTWVLPNLVHRGKTGAVQNNQPNGGLLYYAKDEYGTNRTVNGAGNFFGYRSYNRDATRSQLKGAGLTSQNLTSRAFSSTITIGELTASKNYVIANATRVHGVAPFAATKYSPKAFEGVFKTVVVLNQMNNTGNPNYFMHGMEPIVIFGSNSEGPPSIAGFPLALQVFDARYSKALYQSASSTRDLYWLSTEIVSPWYMRFAGKQNNAGVTSMPYNLFGDVGATLSGGYGDLTYSWYQDVKTNP